MIKLFSLKDQKKGEGDPKASQKKQTAAQLRIAKGKMIKLGYPIS